MKDYLNLSYFTIYTKKTPEEVCAILQEQTAACKMGYWPSDEGAFIGEIGTSSFKVVPRPTWLQPRGIHAVLEGSIRTEADETVVDVKMRLPWGAHLIVPLFFYLQWDFFCGIGKSLIRCIFLKWHFFQWVELDLSVGFTRDVGFILSPNGQGRIWSIFLGIRDKNLERE